MRETKLAYISPYSNKLKMKINYLDKTGATKTTISIDLKPEEYEPIIPLDYILDYKDLSTCEELWELFWENEEDHVRETL